MKETLLNIENHKFINELFEDATEFLSKKEFDLSEIELPENIEFDELEYYIHNVGFYMTYFLKWCKQLEVGVDLLSNFEYKKNSDFNRIDHLTYNIENYIIRFQSISDRLLQLINSVFHLTISESNVTHNVVMTNLKVKRTNIPLKLKPIRKHLKGLYDDRNSIVHRHSYLERELRKLELFYFLNNNDIEPEIKDFRTKKLKDYLKNKKSDFTKNNQELFRLIPDLFDELLIEYRKQRDKLK